MHAIGQHKRLSLANGLLQMFSQADKLRTVSRGIPGVKKKRKKKRKRIFESQNWKSNANPPNKYSNNRIFWSSPSVKFPQSVMIWASMSSAGVGPLCFLKSTVNAAIYQEILEHFMLPSADKLYGDADFIFQQDLAPAHTAKDTKSWFNDHGVTVLDWPANSPELNPIENLWGIVKRKMRDTRPNNADDLKATVKETWASIPPQQCHKSITSMLRWIEAVIKAKGAPTKYWVHIQ